MKVLVFVKATSNSEKGILPSAEQLSRMFADMGKFNEQLAKAGIIKDADGLKPSSAGKRLKFSKGKVTVIDGPFAESREVIAGFSIWEVKDMDEAVAWAKRSPNPMPGKSEIEIRPFYEAADLAEFMTSEELSAPRDGERGKLGVA